MQHANGSGEAGVVAIFCKKLLAGEPARINGDGRYVRDYVFGPDVARANVLALTADLPSVVPGSLTSLNIGTALGTDVNALEELNRAAVATVLARAGRGAVLPLPEHGPSRPGDLRSNLVEPTLAGRVLGQADGDIHSLSGPGQAREAGATGSRVAQQEGNACGSAIDRAILHGLPGFSSFPAASRQLPG
ncbi:MAG: NAD-dependent epimerase/dehydratase family protein, partial [Planctomycetota bacterium]